MKLIQSPPAVHRLALFRDDVWLGAAVGGYLATAVARGEGALVITLPGRWQHISAHLAACARPPSPGQVVFLDAETALAEILASGVSAASLRAVVGPWITRVRAATGALAVRAYGDMVDVLWSRGEPRLALALELAWHELLKSDNITLLCAYRADPLDPRHDAQPLLDLCTAHGHVHATEHGGPRGDAIRRAMEEVLGARELGRLQVVLAAQGLPDGEASAELALLWMRTQVPHLATRIAGRARALLAVA